MSDFNTAIIEEFRANDGKVGEFFEGKPMLLLHTTGARTGRQRVSPLVYQPVGDAFAIFASKGGAPKNPAWYHNLVAYPDTEIEVGSETVEVTARVLADAEREAVWRRQKADMPFFAEYEEKTEREIPVILLERRS